MSRNTILNISMAGFLIAFVSFGTLNAQGKYFTREGKISFVSEALLERNEAINNKVSTAIDATTGKVEFIVLIKSFQFKKALMQEHFNENYMESGKYPKSTFSGQITNLKDIDFTKDGSYKAMVSGKLTMHGVTRDVNAQGTINISKGIANVQSKIRVQLADYDIQIPAIVKDKVAKEVDIMIDCKLKKV